MTAHGATLEVGPGKPYQRIEAALAKARPGDTVLVHPLGDGKAYEKTAAAVRMPKLTIKAARAAGAKRVPISGKGFDYSGRGSTPRAIFQFDRQAQGCTLEGFELFGAHNESHNGAGVRINQANQVTISYCEIHGNDMGIMSGGDGSGKSAVDQRIEFCQIHHNGDFAHPGYNHNLYLGGGSVWMRFCEVHHSLTGHNFKSRAHQNVIECCFIHDSANRELDLVDAAETALPESHAVLVGNIIAKDPQSRGNRAVLHFGQDGGKDHAGTLYMALNTLVTPFIAPVVELSAPNAKAELVGNLIVGPEALGGGRGDRVKQKVVEARAGASLDNLQGTHNLLGAGFASGLGPLAAEDAGRENKVVEMAGPVFVAAGKGNFQLTKPWSAAARLSLTPAGVQPPIRPITDWKPLERQYRHPASDEARIDGAALTAGAVGHAPAR